MMTEEQTQTTEVVDDAYIESLLEWLQNRDDACNARPLELRVGPFWTVVQTTLGTGMASTATYELRPCNRFPIAAAGRLHELSAVELAGLSRSPSAPEASVGLATINSLISYPPEPVSKENAASIILKQGAGKHVAIIGHFPFSEWLVDEVGKLSVFERGARLKPGDLPAEKMDEILPTAEVVAVSATTLINHTLASVMSIVDPGAFVLMLGPSTPMTPLLFELGFDALCGTWISDPLPALRAASQGAVLKQIDSGRQLVAWREPPA
jgi:uncharacterized protein (DUF4213/DUF364 family)